MQTKKMLADADTIQQAANLLRAGQLVAIPTETVYGLAANALDSDAVRKIFIAKGRPQDNPLIVHVDSLDMLQELCIDLPDSAVQLAKAFWPGPLTIVLPRCGKLAPEVSAGLDSVGIRMPDHAVALQVIRQAGVPLAAPSANRSGSPSPTTAQHVLHDLEGRVGLILDGGPAEVGLESTVVSLMGNPVVLRPGAVTPEQIGQVLGCRVQLANSVTRPLEQGEIPASPGMKYRHYAPQAELVVLCGSLADYVEYLKQNTAPGVYALCFEGEQDNLPVPAVAYGIQGDDASQAAALFDALRRLDAQGAAKVYARCPSQNGIGLAVYNRLLRAAGFRVVKL